jgi:23S rRNA (cytidine1920-2'-O)/16S rRNA (cytidine1409-2'-O)-methyltransferase
MAVKKVRADQLLVDSGLAASREQAKRFILAGQVYVRSTGAGSETVSKPGTMLAEDTRLHLRQPERFVSRGGYKLETALEHFGLDVRGWTILDVGASTGGFTDCLLQRGAARVYAVDVGYGQLHWRLRTDPRVVVVERVNMRYAAGDLLPEPVDLATIDCSFISLRRIIAPSVFFLRPGGYILALVKPQFEVSRDKARKGVVRSLESQQEAVEGVSRFAGRELGLESLGSVPSQIKGPKGNQEYLLLLRKPPEQARGPGPREKGTGREEPG